MCSQAQHIDLISLPEQPDCKRPLVAAAISLFNFTLAVWKDRRSVGQGDEREGKGRGYYVCRLTHTHRSDRHTDRERGGEKESWRDVEQLLSLAMGMHPDDGGQTDDYRLADFISGYRFKQSISEHPDID